MQFYLPNFEDLVDPAYNFLTDQTSPDRTNRLLHDRFAHEFFEEPIFDGMLVSKASVAPGYERHIREVGGIHAFTRLNPKIPIMGDCGAFTYILSEKPTYSIQQVIDYYHELDFTYGVSLDHLSFISVEALESAWEEGRVKEKWWKGKTTEQIQKERFELTLRNARDFLDLHTRQKVSFKPIGIAQGSTPEIYYDAVDQLIKMGYQYIALGGLVKSNDKKIIAILEKIHPLIKNDIQVHVFGVARLSIAPHFMRLGITSADSSAPLKKAFFGRTNYWTLDGQKYQAIRVPEANAKRAKRGVISTQKILQNNLELTADTLHQLEQKALLFLRLYDKDEVSLQETLEVVLEYDHLYGDKRDHKGAYIKTLSEKPWKQCSCPICTTLGIDVVIFRGNNRNRRRGFHNVKIFYELLQRVKKAPDDQHLLEGVQQLAFDEVYL